MQNIRRRVQADLPLLSVPEAAAQLGISKTQAWRLIDKGEFPVVYVGDRRIMVRPETLRAYIETREALRKKVRM